MIWVNLYFIFHQKLEKEFFGETIELESADEKDKPLFATTIPSTTKSVKQVGSATNQATPKKKNKAQLLYQKLKKQAKAGMQFGP